MKVFQATSLRDFQSSKSINANQTNIVSKFEEVVEVPKKTVIFPIKQNLINKVESYRSLNNYQSLPVCNSEKPISVTIYGNKSSTKVSQTSVIRIGVTCNLIHEKVVFVRYRHGVMTRVPYLLVPESSTILCRRRDTIEMGSTTVTLSPSSPLTYTGSFPRTLRIRPQVWSVKALV